MNKNITVMTVFAALLFTTILSPVSAYAQNTATQMPSATTTPSATQTPAATNQPTAAPKKKQKKKKSVTKITISAAGDCTLGSDYKSPASVNFYAKYKQKTPSYFFKNVKNIFKKDDLTLVNFEGTLTTRSTRADKTFAFKGNPSYLKILQKGNVDAISFANNHCRDFGNGSYHDTISVFKKNKMPFASYSKVSIYKTNGKKIGMIAVNGLEGVSSSKHYIKSGIQKLKKKKADLIIVSMHAGIEKTSSLDVVQKSIAHYAVKQGANLVLGHHPHVLQGIEKYKGAYIVYSLANFCFGGNRNPEDKDTFIFRQTFTVSDDGVGFDPEQPPQDGKEHVGLQLVRDRLQMVCGAKLTTQSKIGQGTLMRVLIPYSCDETAGSFTQTKAPSH